MDNILDYNLEELQKIFVSKGFLAYKATQVFEWMYQKMVFDFQQMSSISAVDAKKLSMIFEQLSFDYEVKVGRTTKKYLIKTEDDYLIESVIIPGMQGNTLCVSTQIGCPLKCKFCETGHNGFVRNLTVAEIVMQYLIARKEGLGVDRIVYMGMGEPLLNLENVIKATYILNESKGANLGLRKITISTAGVIPGIRKLIEEGHKLNLAVSLHAPNDDLRRKLMPINDKYGLNDLFKLLKEYRKATGRRITLEYVMLQGINDSEREAKQLIEWVKGTDFHLNLIPYNKTSADYKCSKKTDRFLELLQKANVNVTKRRSEGEDISAACGMLSGKKHDR